MSFIIFDKLQQPYVFIELPRALLKMRTEVASPMLSALLRVSIYFVLVLIQPIELLRNFLPVLYFSLLCQIVINPFSHNGSKY